MGIAVDSTGDAYVTGLTYSSNFPTSPGAFQPTYGGAFVTKLNPTGSALVYSIFLGASSSDFGWAIAIDAAGNAYVTGGAGPGFPTTPGAFETTYNGYSALITKLNPTGSTLVYSTYLGGTSIDVGRAIAVDAAGNAYVAGDTQSSDFPTTPGAFQFTRGGNQQTGFITKLNPDGSLIYSTYLGGSGSAERGSGIAVDAAGNAYVTGETTSADFPTTPDAYQPAFGGVGDAFVTILNPTGSALVYSTFLGGPTMDRGSGIALGAAGNAYVTGGAGLGLPTTPGVFQSTYAGGGDVFVAKIGGAIAPNPPVLTRLVADGSDSEGIASRVPLILIHGIHGNAQDDGTDDIERLNRAHWLKFIAAVADNPAFRARYKLYRFHYVSDRYPVWELARGLRNDIEALISSDPAFDKPIVIVAHSMGGLVARSYMQEHSHTHGAYANRRGGERVERVITLATPHHGSPAANLAARDDLVTNLSGVACVSCGLAAWAQLLGRVDAGFWSEALAADPTRYNRSDLRSDNFDNRLRPEVYGTAAERNDWLISLNSTTTYDSKIVAYYGYIDPNDPMRLYYGDLLLGPLRIAAARDIIRTSDHLSLIVASAIFDSGLAGRFPPYGGWAETDGLVPVESAGFAGRALKRVRCPGHDHLHMLAGSIASCETGLTLFDSLRTDLELASARPAGNSAISGTVVDRASGTPIDGARVRLGTQSAVTSAGGDYRFAEVPAGNHVASVEKSGYATVFETVGVPPLSSIRKDFALRATAPLADVTVIGVTSKYSGRVYYLDGIDHEVTFTANVDWGDRSPAFVRFTTPRASYDVPTPTTAASRPFNMGRDFGPCGRLTVRAFAADGASSAEHQADFVVMSRPTGSLPSLGAIDIGDGFYYRSTASFALPVFDREIPAGAIPDRIPLFGGHPARLSFAPSLTTEITSDGEASFTLEPGELSRTIPRGRLAGWEFSLAPQFSLTGHFAEASCGWRWGGAAGLEGRAAVETPPWYFLLPLPPPLPPVPMFLKAGLEVAAGGSAQIVGFDPLRLQGNVGVGAGVIGTLGAGIDHVANVTGFLRGSADLGLHWPGPPPVDLTLSLGGGVCASFFVFETCWAPDLLRWDWSYPPEASGQQMAQAPAEQLSAPRLAAREYLRRPGHAKFEAARAVRPYAATVDGQRYATAVAAIETTVFPQSQPSLAGSGSHLQLVWLADDPARTAINRTSLRFSTWDGATWSQPVPMADDGTADFHPHLLTFADGAALVVWENVKTVLPDTAPLEDLVANLEIAAAAYDPQTQQWTARSLTANTVLDRSPKIAGPARDNVLLVWISNAANDLRGSAASPNTVWASTWNGLAWSAPQAVATVPFGIVKYDLAYDGTRGYVALSLDTDDDPATVDDRELYLLAYDGGAWSPLTRLTTDSVPDDNPKLAIDPSGDIVLVWLKGSELSSAVNVDMARRQVVATAQYSTNLADFKLGAAPSGRLALVWAEPSGFGSDIWAFLYDPIFDLWGARRQLTFDEETEQNLTAAFYTGNTLVAVYDRTRLALPAPAAQGANGTAAAPIVPVAGATDLYMAQHVLRGDLRADTLTVTPANPRPGDPATLSVTVMNLGDTTSADVPVAFYQGDPAAGGAVIGTAMTATLAPGDVTEVSISWAVPSASAPIAVYSVVDPNELFDDANRANNVVHRSLVKPDLTIENVRWEQPSEHRLVVTARVRNSGSLTSAATTVTFRQGSLTGPTLAVEDLPALMPDHAMDVSIQWDIQGLTGPEYAIHLAADEANLVDEHDEGNNTQRLVLQPYFTLSVGKAGTGAGRVVGSAGGIDCGPACSARYPVGTTLTLDAIPAAGSEFSGWSGACSGTGACTVTIAATRSVTATFRPLRPDLTVTSVSTPSRLVSPGATIDAAVTIANQGPATAGASNATLYLSRTSAGSHDAGRVGARLRVPSLAPGESATRTVRVKLPRDLSPGPYVLRACVDDLRRVVETDEMNNCSSAAGTLTVRGPDLVVVEATPALSSVRQGGRIGVTTTLENQGSAAARTSATRFYLSADGSRNGSNRRLVAEWTAPAILPGARATSAAQVIVPPGVPPGYYYVIACADDLGRVRESDETNNCRSSASPIQVHAR